MTDLLIISSLVVNVITILSTHISLRERIAKVETKISMHLKDHKN